MRDGDHVARVLKRDVVVAMQIHSAPTESGFQAPPSDTCPRDFSLMAKVFPTLSVLVVDDESLIRWSLAQTLMEQGHVVREAADGRGAIEVLQHSMVPVDVIMLDYRLPDTTALQMLGPIRALSPESRVVLMTAYGTPEISAEALRLGAVCVVHKPLDMHDVGDLVARAYASS
jgi:DNA-binding NtrC family response regulator